MNILVVSYYQIYPFKIGASIAQFGMIEYLSTLCNISLLLPENNTLTVSELTELQKLLPKVKIYMVENKKNSSPNKVISIILKIYSFFQSLTYKIKYKIKKLFLINKEKKYSVEQEFLELYYNYNPFPLHSDKYIDIIYDIIFKDKIDIVQLEFVENLNLVSIIPQNIKKVFVQHESLFYRIKSHIDTKQIKSLTSHYILNFYKNIEFTLLSKFDGIMSFNKLENFLLETSLKPVNSSTQCCISPYPVLEKDFQELDRQLFIKPNKLIFVGGEQHLPNKDAVEWFISESGVEIFQKFGLKLYVVGKWQAETVKKYKNHPSQVEFVGFIEDLYEFSKNSISIAPVRIGGGLKTKIMLAMAQGIPVICTKFALEGIHANHLESVMIAEDKNSFSFAVEYLLADLERTFIICKNAQNLMREKYSQAVVSEIRYKFYKNILQSNQAPESVGS
ncbi:MAG: glycosyltransferase [Calothrix sp. C42_A2020_038]|nr:glycosyltransferase [Calothrix sp. C42_A2020_038]